MGTSLFERIGGEPAIMAAVDRFYQKVLADEQTGRFFAALDVDGQTRKQVAFMAWAFGCPRMYGGRDLRTAHARLVRDEGLGDLHFDRILKHLEDSLRELGVEESLIEEALAITSATRDEVLNR
jgi:hemoglobin